MRVSISPHSQQHLVFNFFKKCHSDEQNRVSHYCRNLNFLCQWNWAFCILLQGFKNALLPKNKVNSPSHHLISCYYPIATSEERKRGCADPPRNAMLFSFYSSFCLFPLHSISTYGNPTPPSRPFFRNSTFIHSSSAPEEVPCCSPAAVVSPSQNSESTLE